MVKVCHLIVDSTPIIDGKLDAGMAEIFYTVPAVLQEIQDQRSRQLLERSQIHPQIMNPSASSLKEIIRFSKLTGDFPSLSLTDIKVMALCLDLAQKYNPSLELRTEPSTSTTAGKPKSAPKGKKENQDDEAGWITPLNIDEIRNKPFIDEQSNNDDGVEKPGNQEPIVACATNDFAMQNCMLQMGLKVIGAGGCMVHSLKSFVLRCHVCYHVTKEMEKVFCPACGHNSLLRVTYALDSDGNMRLFLKRNFQYNNRGTKYSIPNPLTAGKDKLIFTEDQKEYQREYRRLEKSMKNIALDDDYVFAEPNSQLKQPTHRVKIGHGRKNINAVRRKK